MPTLGLLMLQTRFPRPLGDVGHPRTFGFAVRRLVVQGATPERAVRGKDAVPYGFDSSRVRAAASAEHAAFMAGS